MARLALLRPDSWGSMILNACIQERAMGVWVERMAIAVIVSGCGIACAATPIESFAGKDLTLLSASELQPLSRILSDCRHRFLKSQSSLRRLVSSEPWYVWKLPREHEVMFIAIVNSHLKCKAGFGEGFEWGEIVESKSNADVLYALTFLRGNHMDPLRFDPKVLHESIEQAVLVERLRTNEMVQSLIAKHARSSNKWIRRAASSE